MEEIPWVSDQESFELTEEHDLYKDFYTTAAETIRNSDTSTLAPPPPLMRNTSIISTIDNAQPPICHAELDFSFEPYYETETESPCTWEDIHYFDSDILSAEEVVSDEEVMVEKKKIKRTRKNYTADIINILMDWYLAHDGVVPTNSQKKILAGRTGKTEAQIGTWFQNAKKRHIKKLQQFKSLSAENPDLVHDYRSLKSFLKMKK